ncbi:Hypothetical protein SMAX5B_005441 [Scophthalmus maximus]|uniref:Uncharacterized protein n=1 Tax=Scophthalmus maximus TaxID=52904 RepID=A0A2U9B239_SCOMX|nr:Hypothetical protein SMAX5B_005441 [Scophthalmus maximus]
MWPLESDAGDGCHSYHLSPLRQVRVRKQSSGQLSSTALRSRREQAKLILDDIALAVAVAVSRSVVQVRFQLRGFPFWQKVLLEKPRTGGKSTFDQQSPIATCGLFKDIQEGLAIRIRQLFQQAKHPDELL